MIDDGLDFGGYIKPPDVPPDPIGNDWRGPPGPQGPPGPGAAPSDTVPPMDGVGAAGTAATASRGDHAHPSDTSRLPLAGGQMTGPLNVTATGGSAVRSVQARAGDVANICDYGAGTGTSDDALAFRNALASGKRVIYVPPGDYTFRSKSTATQDVGGLNFQPTPCVLFNGLNNVAVIAYGATFRIDDAITSPDAGRSNAGNAHCGFIGDCHHVTWSGGRFYGNTTNAGTAVNTGMWFQNCTQVLIEDTEWLGSYPQAPIFGGVWLFDCTFRGNRAYGSGQGFDLAWCENLTIQNNWFDGNHTAGNVAGNAVKLFTDPNTKTFNTSGHTVAPVTWLTDGTIRNLVGGMSNSVRIVDNRFNGWANGVFLDGTYEAHIVRNSIRYSWSDAANQGSTAPIYLVTSDDTAAIGTGVITRDIAIRDNAIYDNQTSAILLGPQAHGMGAVDIIGNRIYDNTCPQAILWLTQTSIGAVRIEENDFASRTGSSVQAAVIDPTQLANVRAAGGTYSRNLGVTPYAQFGDVFSETGRIVASAATNSSVGVSDTTSASGMFISSGQLNFGSLSTAGVPTAGWGTWTGNGVALPAGIGVHGAAASPAKPAVTGAKGGNVALASLLTVLAAYGFLTDSSTA
jgi:hypothetical protein